MVHNIDNSRLIAVNKDKVLVLKKISKQKKYSLAGGVKKKKETNYQSLTRETFEEIGVDLTKSEISYFLCINHDKKNNTTVSRHYFITKSPIVRFKILEPHKFKEVLWVDWVNALEYLDKYYRSAITSYFKQATNI